MKKKQHIIRIVKQSLKIKKISSQGKHEAIGNFKIIIEEICNSLKTINQDIIIDTFPINAKKQIKIIIQK
jgi:hypothetical protein